MNTILSPQETAKRLFVKEVYDNAQEIDPDNELHWDSLAYGFFLAAGFTIEEAIVMYGELKIIL